jgi:hypothetical protein
MQKDGYFFLILAFEYGRSKWSTYKNDRFRPKDIIFCQFSLQIRIPRLILPFA